MPPGDLETRRPGDQETRRPEDQETRRPGDLETRRPGDRFWEGLEGGKEQLGKRASTAKRRHHEFFLVI